ncbi:MAG: hypothetical protein WBE78_08230, partial [Candidatus Binataceae bacterium]
WEPFHNYLSRRPAVIALLRTANGLREKRILRSAIAEIASRKNPVESGRKDASLPIEVFANRNSRKVFDQPCLISLRFICGIAFAF